MDEQKRDEYYVCDICNRKMAVPDSRISLKRFRYIFSKEEPTSKTTKDYDLCKDCYNKVNDFVRDMIIMSKKKKQ